MRFKSKDDQEKRVANTDGHVAIIGAEWRELPEHLHGLAYAAGCISDDMLGKIGRTTIPSSMSVDSVIEAMKVMLERNEPSDFTKAGLPDRTAVNKLCGGKVPAEICDSAWAQLSKDSEA